MHELVEKVVHTHTYTEMHDVYRKICWHIGRLRAPCNLHLSMAMAPTLQAVQLGIQVCKEGEGGLQASCAAEQQQQPKLGLFERGG